MHRSTGLRAYVAVDLQPLVSLELKDIVGAVTEENERDPGEPVKPVGQAVLAAIDLLRDRLGVALVGPAGSDLGCPSRTEAPGLPKGGVYRVRILDEVGAVETSGAAPVAELAIVVLAGELHAGAAAVEIAVAIFLRRVAEIGARVVALLRRRRPPDLSIVAEVSALMRELGEYWARRCGRSMPKRSPYLSSATSTDARLLSFPLPFAAARTC
ncbi:hypothetical protein I7F30_05015 [Sinorhizobium meliloti]|nr:hypothetical protein [Sinorhizobium meliloti]MDE3854386.1 hypothetical protein [Sinorhizobium meliloti]